MIAFIARRLASHVPSPANPLPLPKPDWPPMNSTNVGASHATSTAWHQNRAAGTFRPGIPHTAITPARATRSTNIAQPRLRAAKG